MVIDSIQKTDDRRQKAVLWTPYGEVRRQKTGDRRGTMDEGRGTREGISNIEQGISNVEVKNLQIRNSKSEIRNSSFVVPKGCLTALRRTDKFELPKFKTSYHEDTD